MFREWSRMMALGWDSQQVIALRLAKLAKGDLAAAREANLMISEKALEAGKAFVTFACGGSMQSVVGSYHEKVRGNKRRLGRR